MGDDLNLTDQDIFNFAALHNCEAGPDEKLLSFARAVEFTAQAKAARAAFNKWGQPAHTPVGVPEDRLCADTAKRLRRVCNLIGLVDSIPKEDEKLGSVVFAVLGMVARRLESIPAPDEYEEVVEQYKWQYFYRKNGCPAIRSDEPWCICWNDEGTGVFKDALHGHKYDTGKGPRDWRIKPSDQEQPQ